MQGSTMMAAAPERSLRQRMDALGKANHVRTYRAGLKRELKAGTAKRDARDVIFSPTHEEETWKVFDLLMSLPKVGRVKANKMLQMQRVSPSKTVGGLSDRQRAALLGVLPAR